MTEQEVLIEGDAGVHARPAMMMVQESQKFPSCRVLLIKDDIEADCNSIMSVLGLAIVSGTRLLIRAEGEGEAEVVDNLVNLIKGNFGKG